MNAHDRLDELLDAKFREETPYIDDDGFTARVMQNLPRGRVALSTQRSVIIFAAAILSAIIAYFASGEGMFVQQLVARASTLTPLQVLLLTVASGFVLTIAALWTALSKTTDQFV